MTDLYTIQEALKEARGRAGKQHLLSWLLTIVMAGIFGFSIGSISAPDWLKYATGPALYLGIACIVGSRRAYINFYAALDEANDGDSRTKWKSNARVQIEAETKKSTQTRWLVFGTLGLAIGFAFAYVIRDMFPSFRPALWLSCAAVAVALLLLLRWNFYRSSVKSLEKALDPLGRAGSLLSD